MVIVSSTWVFIAPLLKYLLYCVSETSWRQNLPPRPISTPSI